MSLRPTSLVRTDSIAVTPVPTGTLSNDSIPFQFNIGTVFIALRCWWKILFPVALLFGTAAGGAVYLFHSPKYTADAWLLIKEKPDVILRELETDSRFIQNQMEIIRSPRLLGPLASNPEILATPELRNEQDIPRALARRLKIVPRGESDIYVLSFTSESPEKAELVVREVVSAYLAFNRKLDSEQQSQIIRLLEDQRAARYEEMNQLRENVRTLSMQLTGVDPFRASENLQERKISSSLANLQTEIVRLEVAQDVLAAHIKAEEENRPGLHKEPAENVERQIKSHPSYVALQARVDQLRQKEAEFLRTGKNLATNPLYMQLQRDLQSETLVLRGLEDNLRAELVEGAQRGAESERDGKLAALKAEYESGATRLRVLSEKFQHGMKTAQQFAGDSLGLDFQRAKLEQVTKIHDEISSRILAITTEQRAPDRVMPFKEATLPLRPDETIPWKNIVVAAIAALLIPFALAIGWEHFFRRVSCRSQVESANHIAVVGEITSLPRTSRRLWNHHSRERDAILFQESVDSLRTYLCLVDELRDLRVLAITSAVSREGKTSLSAQLAASVARASGESTLLIDGDLRSPDLHDKFGVDLLPGLAEVLRNEFPLTDAIRTTSHEKLFLLTAGQLTSSPHRLLADGAFCRVLEQLRPKYRYIIVDTPPILPASESLVLARAADATVLCMRRDFSRLDQVEVAQSRMADAGVKLAGAVLNGIPMNHYARKYGCYVYGTAGAHG